MFAFLRDRINALLRSKFVQDTITLQIGKLFLTAVNLAAFVVVVRVLGSARYGEYQLVLTMHGLLLTLDITGLNLSTVTRLAEAVAARDRGRVLGLLGFFVQVSLAVAVIAAALAWAFAPTVAAASYDNAAIGELMRWYTLILFLLPVYRLGLLSAQGMRAMRTYTLLESGGSAALAGLRITAAVVWGTPAALIGAHLLAEAIKAAAGLWVYARMQRRYPDVLPTVGESLRTARRQSPRPYWRFGVALAVDKNIAQLYTLLPRQLLGMWVGEEAVGFLALGQSALQYPALLFGGILTNLAVRFPADVGRADFAGLWRNFRRVFTWTSAISVLMFAGVAVAAPILPLILGEEYIPAIPVIRVLSIYGAVTGIGGVFGPLYRALRMMRAILLVKAAALLVAAVPAALLIPALGAVGGAWTINIVYAVSVALTIAVVLPPLRRRAIMQMNELIE